MADSGPGGLILNFPDVASAENYRRDLNLDTAVAGVEYAANGAIFSGLGGAADGRTLMEARIDNAGAPGNIGALQLTFLTGFHARSARILRKDDNEKESKSEPRNTP
jgi:hypothetical protein